MVLIAQEEARNELPDEKVREAAARLDASEKVIPLHPFPSGLPDESGEHPVKFLDVHP